MLLTEQQINTLTVYLAFSEVCLWLSDIIGY